MARVAPWHRWERAAVEKTFTVESRQKSKALFLQTHLPIDRILVDVSRDGAVSAGTFIDEAALLALLRRVAPEADNRIFFVVGETGCGKSELCQWLEYSLQGSAQVPIHLSRRTTHTSEIARVLASHLPPGAATFGGAFHLEKVPAEDLAARLASGALVRALAQRHADDAEREAWGALLRDRRFFERVTDEVMAYHARLGDAEADRSFLDFWPAERHTAALAEHAASTLTALPVDHHRKLREWLLVEIRSLLQIENLNTVLEQVSRHYARLGKRPVLILEDITTFGFLRDDLFDYLFDLTSGHFDAVIGLTRGFERTQLHAVLSEDDLTYLQERIAGRFVLTGDEGETFFLESDRPVALLRRYLDTVVPSNARDVAFDGLYPFNREAVLRLFASLSEEGQPKQTPRLLLNHLVRQMLLSEEPPHAFLARENAYLTPPAMEFRRDGLGDAGIVQLMRWYGTYDEESVSLDRRVADVWEVPYPSEALKGNVIVLPRLRIRAAVEPRVFQRPEPQVEEWRVALDDLQRWLEGDSGFPSREFLKRGVEKLLLQLGNPRVLGREGAIAASGDVLVYSRGEERVPQVLTPDSGDPPITDELPRLVIERSQAGRAALEELLLYQWGDRADLQELSRPAHSLAWTESHAAAFHSDVQAYVAGKLGGMEWAHVVLFAWGVVSNLTTGMLMRPHPDLLRRLPPHEAAEDWESPWAMDAPQSPLYGPTKWSRPLYDRREVYQNLMVGHFYLRENFWDMDYFEACLASFVPADIGRRLAALDLSALRSVPFRTQRGRVGLFELIEPLVRYVQALERVDAPKLIATMTRDMVDLSDVLGRQEGLVREELYTQIQGLRSRFSVVGVAWPEALDAAQQSLVAMDLASLDELRTAIADALALPIAPDAYGYVSLFHRHRRVKAHPFARLYAELALAIARLEEVAKRKYGSAPRARQVHSTAPYKRLNDALKALKEAFS